ncbi:MAG: gamma-glutamyltransferase [Planctomycetota bacterium]
MKAWILLLLFFCTACVSPVETGPVVNSNKGVVVCVDSIAAKVGTDILARGGNAVDAAVAMGLALAVTHPQAGNLGGGGFMVIRLDDGRLATIDYRERAPGGSHPEMYLKEDGTIDRDARRLGFKACGVPGTVAGLYDAYRKYGGNLDWYELVEPARLLAEEGFKVDFDLNNSFKKAKKDLDRFPSTVETYFRTNGEILGIGEWLVQPNLAKTLASIQNGGSDGFYKGPVSEELIRAITAGGGIMTATDLKTYLVKERVPLRWKYRDVEIVAVGLPSSGGVILQEMLNILSGYDLKNMPESDRFHLLVETMRRAFCDRALYLGDPDFMEPPLEKLLSMEHAEALRATIDMKRKTSSHNLDHGLTIQPAGTAPSDSSPERSPASGQTTHFCVADSKGNIVSNTYTLEMTFGCKAVAGNTGVLMNNEMGDFNPKPGWTDEDGNIGTTPNLIAPGKRMLSSMCPVILLKEGQPFAAFGSPGGRSIINTVLQVIVNVVDLGLKPELAIQAPRLHHQWFPDKVYLEKTMPWSVKESLKSHGHVLEEVDRLGDCHALFFTDWGIVNTITGVADKRIDGCVSGL